MAVQWNKFFIFSLKSFATFKTAFVSSVQRELVGRVFFFAFKLEVIYKVDGYTSTLFR